MIAVPLAPRALDELVLLPINLRMRVERLPVGGWRPRHIRGLVLLDLDIGEHHPEAFELPPLLIGHEGVRHRDLGRDSALADEIIPFIGRRPTARRRPLAPGGDPAAAREARLRHRAACYEAEEVPRLSHGADGIVVPVFSHIRSTGPNEDRSMRAVRSRVGILHPEGLTQALTLLTANRARTFSVSSVSSWPTWTPGLGASPRPSN